MLPKMKLVVLISFLLLPLCTSKFGDSYGDGFPHTVQYSVNMVEESIPEMIDYPKRGVNPNNDQKRNGWGRPVRPPPSPMNSKNHKVQQPPPQMNSKNHHVQPSPPKMNFKNDQTINGWGRPVRPSPPQMD
ncbi:PREDICTED: uncharacterized protein LOC104787361 [Camelina sativa]|uniref:Uncharacterized protein LOC104787361 n=1 Tax=Camelina sativa TaxID=90675 RepID=A0ABM0Z6T8_CAMSA|nr:PREDICTED: uncharacterized protein LOC104787361 [Camelina sativa]